jgi:SAM-dependent methyltransferase
LTSPGAGGDHEQGPTGRSDAKASTVADSLKVSDLEPAYQRFIDVLLALRGADPKSFCTEISPADEMFAKAILPNFEHDKSIAHFKFIESCGRLFVVYGQLVEQVFGDFAALRSVLDFASGYGRLTRFLVQKLPPDRIWVSDIYADAMSWQAATFGVRTLLSTAAPADFPHQGEHDIVFVGSLFSHLPAGRFQDWLAKLYSLLSPGGVLAFSVHDETYLPSDERMDHGGIRYFRFSESGTLDADSYGMTYVTEQYVAAAIAKLAPGVSVAWRRFRKALYENQDMYVVAGPQADLSRLRLASTPHTGIESVSILTNGDLECRGWAIELTPDHQIRRIVAHIDGVPTVETAPVANRPDILQHFPHNPSIPVSWGCRLPREKLRANAIIRAHVESDTGLVGYCYACVPGSMAMTYSGWSRRAVRAAQSR